MDRITPASVATALVIGVATAFVLWQLDPGLLLADTTPSGGDMGAHVWLPDYVRDHLLPKGRITGWAPDWYAGFPALVFYFPLPTLLIVAADVVLPYTVAFKLVTVLGLLTLPTAAWAFGKLAGLRAPGPACLAVGTLPFLFDRSFTIYGGNIPSTLAGEFAFSVSLSLALVFLGVFARGLDTGRHGAAAAVLLAATGLSHVLPTLFAVAGALVLFALRADRHRLRWAGPVCAVAGALAAFWLVPIVFRLPYMNDMGWEKILAYRENLIPHDSRWVVLLGLAGAVAAVARRSRVGIFLTAMAALSAVAFWLMPDGRLWNARMLPFWYLSLYLLGSLAVAELGRVLAAGWDAIGGRDEEPPGEERAAPEPRGQAGHDVAAWATPVVALLAALTVVGVPLNAVPDWLVRSDDRSFVPDWVRWNYTGYERKAAYPEYRSLIETMRNIGDAHGCGRAMWEYEPELDRLGTPMALMLLPYWTNGCIGSMEGLFFESSATTPYHFLNQAELSAKPSSAMRDLPYRSLSVDKGVEHLQLLGVRYYMALSPEAQAQARANPDLELLDRSGPWSVSYSRPDLSGVQERTWEIYRVADSELVAPLNHMPVVMRGVPKGGEGWLEAAVDWYQDSSRWEVALAASGPREWPRVDGAEHDPPRQGVPEARVSNIRSDDDGISFDVDRPGTPVLVKASYFPNWKASGADGPWRVTPNLMVVVPTERHVSLRYGWTPVDVLGWLLTLAGVAGLVWLWRRGPVEMPEPPAPVVAEPPSPSGEDRELELAPAHPRE